RAPTAAPILRGPPPTAGRATAHDRGATHRCPGPIGASPRLAVRFRAARPGTRGLRPAIRAAWASGRSVPGARTRPRGCRWVRGRAPAGVAPRGGPPCAARPQEAVDRASACGRNRSPRRAWPTGSRRRHARRPHRRRRSPQRNQPSIGGRRMIYELREYVAHPGAADKLHRRFRDKTLALFARHGLEVAGFWVDEKDPNRIVYLLKFPDA